uniref:Uncharacterized protein n=1 Tax=Trichobilharzia regenti TaxID=157069 RepID=A0AA85J1X6_TRIRE|nr:unnamed protein product [Trichobilharzia regenti]
MQQNTHIAKYYYYYYYDFYSGCYYPIPVTNSNMDRMEKRKLAVIYKTTRNKKRKRKKKKRKRMKGETNKQTNRPTLKGNRTNPVTMVKHQKHILIHSLIHSTSQSVIYYLLFICLFIYSFIELQTTTRGDTGNLQ